MVNDLGVPSRFWYDLSTTIEQNSITQQISANFQMLYLRDYLEPEDNWRQHLHQFLMRINAAVNDLGVLPQFLYDF